MRIVFLLSRRNKRNKRNLVTHTLRSSFCVKLYLSIALVNHRKDDCGILTEALTMGKVVKQDIGINQCFYFAHSCQRSSSSFSKSTPSGNLPNVIAITFADGL